MARSVLWFRRDLRLNDHPALLAAAAAARPDAGEVVALFVLDPALWGPAGPARRAWLLRSLRALDTCLDGRLAVRRGAPQDVVTAVAAEQEAGSVHVTADAGPYGRRRDDAVAERLRAGGRTLVRTGTPYAIGPGTVRTATGRPYQVFTPFARAWTRAGWPAPAGGPGDVPWARGVPTEALPPEPDLEGMTLPAVGEAAALRRWRRFVQERVPSYHTTRDLPALDGTSAMSAHLKYGEVHPRTLLADLAPFETDGARRYRDELCWREFYADVQWHRPDAARSPLRPQYADLVHDEPGSGFDAWREGRTGYPFVDAGMRQLRAEGWVHNRVRMVVASFCVKDLHLPWQLGARYFLHWLRDGDLASNNQGWQWVAGSGTDASPYHRVLNPVTQGRRFDPDGDYVRRYVPELRHLAGGTAHEPWSRPDGYAHGYPARILDHARERSEALSRHRDLAS